MTDKTIQELEAEIRAIREVERAELQRKLDSTQVIRRFTVRVDDDRYDQVYDDSCLKYRIEGEVVNFDEATEAGHSIRAKVEGMTYLYNTLSGKLVMSLGGGTVWLAARGWGNKPNEVESAVQALEEVGQFIQSNPEGGDITDIILRHNERIGRTW